MSRLPDVLAYGDFRAYLRDYYAAEKRRDPRFSYGVFARRAGIGWRGHFNQVVEGRRKLTRATTAKYVKGLGLSPEQGEYFALLADLGQAATAAERRSAAEALTRWRQDRAIRRITLEEHNEITSRWPRQMIFTLSLAKGFVADPAWISRSLSGLVSTKAAREALSFLVSRGYLRVEGRRLLETYAGRLQFTASTRRPLRMLETVQARQHRLAASVSEPALPRHYCSGALILRKSEAYALGDRFRRWWEANLPVANRPGMKGDLYMALWDLFPVSRISGKRSRGR